MNILIVGATGSIGRLVVQEALRQAHVVRAMVRSQEKARQLPPEAEPVIADVTRPETLAKAVDDVGGIIFTLGSDGQGKAGAENIDYGGVRNVLRALGSREVRIALMTSIGVTKRDSSYNRSTEAHDWKRRSERLVHASGMPYTIVRPGWFDYNKPDECRLVFLQGDKRHAGNPSDGVIARQQIAHVLVQSVTSEAARRKTFELVAVKGAAQENLEPLFGALEADPEGSLDGVHLAANMAVENEPARVKEDFKVF